MYRADTIAACATPPGRGAVAIVRLSGPEALRISSRVFRASSGTPLQPWRLTHGCIADPQSGDDIDEALAVFMPAPRSYTGEDVCEMHCHGSPVVVESVLSLVTSLGARAAQRGEFTRRAVLNGRLDVLQAEAVADIIDARTQGAVKLAWEQLQGALSGELDVIREQLLAVLADIEANVDFTEDELPAENVTSRLESIDAAAERISSLVSGFAVGRRQREGVRAVFVGRPNVGKSSLINALLGHGRMIVSEEPGTTRDTVEELVDLGGVAFLLTDTAGLRDADGIAEAAAIERARETIESADVLLSVVDGSVPLGRGDEAAVEWAARKPALLIVNKCDLPSGLTAADAKRLRVFTNGVLMVSALTGEGCDKLVTALATLATRGIDYERSPIAISRVRHLGALESVSRTLVDARSRIAYDDEPELAALELRAALATLAEVVAPLDNEEVLDVIFRDFCIGK